MMPQFSGEDARGGDGIVHEPEGVARHFRLNPEDFAVGFTWFLMGLGKKVLIADKLAPTADVAFNNAGHLSVANAWAGLIVYSMQLYFDFSGYSDMALGLARIFSIRFPLNFDSPYKAISVTEYWQRWHMTLTRYITLYLYNPLLLAVQRGRIGRGRKISRKALATFGGFTTMVAYPTLLTMLLTGLWHGAGLQFIVFGLIHGIYLTANQAWRHFRQRAPNAAMPASPAGARRFAMMLGVYLQVTFALIFFRSDSMHGAFALLGDMFGRHGAGTFSELLAGIFAFCLFPVVWFFPNTQQILGQETVSSRMSASPGAPGVYPAAVPTPSILNHLRWKPNLAWAFAMFVLFFAILANLDATVRFLYFQF
jgi:alginate O-acetyltransferase complex protein AlgI